MACKSHSRQTALNLCKQFVLYRYKNEKELLIYLIMILQIIVPSYSLKAIISNFVTINYHYRHSQEHGNHEEMYKYLQEHPYLLLN